MDHDVHQHQRSTDTDDVHGHHLRAAADSSVAKFMARIVTPALLAGLLAVSGFIGTRLLKQLDDQTRDLQAVKSDVRDLNTRLTEGVIRQVNANSDRIADHEKRLQTIERVVRTP